MSLHLGVPSSTPPFKRVFSLTDPPPKPTSEAEDDRANRLILPDGSTADREEFNERKKQRDSEDRDYIPVIIKRTDETRRHPDDALDDAILEGLEQLNRPPISLGLSAIAAGMIVGFSALAVAVVLTAVDEIQATATVSRIATAFVYPLGFVVCIISGAQLYTEHTATALYPVLDKKAGITRLIRLWLIVILGNLTGAAICAGLLVRADEVVHAQHGYMAIGHHLVQYSGPGLFVSAILAGWLMALGAWLAISSPRTISQIIGIYVVTFLIGIGGLHHSIAGSVEMFTAMLFDPSQFTPLMAARFISLALLGNLVGGSFFVALLNYAYIRRTND